MLSPKQLLILIYIVSMGMAVDAITIVNSIGNAKIENTCTQKADFYPVQDAELLKKIALYQRADAATPLLVKLKGNEIVSSCSSTFISSNGYLLSAAHCLEDCLVKNKILEPKQILPTSSLNSSQESATALVLNRENLSKKATCRVLIPGMGPMDAEVVAAPRCLLKFSSYSRVKNEKVSDPACVHSEDFMVLKIPSEAPTACLNASVGGIPQNGMVWGMGYAIKTERGSFDSDGQNKQLIAGHRNDLDSCVLDPYNLKGQKRDVKTDTNLEGHHHLTTDGAAWMSGAGILNMSGEVVGVQFAVSDPSQQYGRTLECRGGTTAVDMRLIRDSIASQTSTKQFNQIFNCSTTAGVDL